MHEWDSWSGPFAGGPVTADGVQNFSFIFSCFAPAFLCICVSICAFRSIISMYLLAFLLLFHAETYLLAARNIISPFLVVFSIHEHIDYLEKRFYSHHFHPFCIFSLWQVEMISSKTLLLGDSPIGKSCSCKPFPGFFLLPLQRRIS
jgi:hypothetical protein